ncbi:MAG: hypothetical protein AABW90_02410 [Nanoarchaeota archaeon]
MPTFIEQIADHIKKNLKKGYTIDALRFSLISQGYTRISVEKAIELANKKLAEELPLMKEKPEITYKVEPVIQEKKSFFKRILDWLFRG